VRQSGLSFLKFFRMQVVIRFASGTYSRHNLIASERQARRCSGVPAAWDAVDKIATEMITAIAAVPPLKVFGMAHHSGFSFQIGERPISPAWLLHATNISLDVMPHCSMMRSI
jgi:hypothetical protein